MKKLFYLFALMLVMSSTVKSQATLDSVTIAKYPFFLSNCGDSVCEDGMADVHISNATTPYLVEVYYLNGTVNLLYSQYWTGNGTFPKSICRDSLLFIVTDTAFSTSDSLLIPIEDLYCPMDTIRWAHPVVPIDSVQILAFDTIFSIPDTIPTGKVRIWPRGGHRTGYIYKLDTVLRGSSPQPPTSSNPGYNVYRNWQDSAIYDSLFSRWYGVTCVDTTRLIPIVAPKPGIECVFCGDTLKDSIEPFWFYLPNVTAGHGPAPQECQGGVITDCNPYTGSTISLSVVGGMPPYTVSGTGIAPYKVYRYGGSFSASVVANNCGSASISITDSLGLVNCSYSGSDVKEALLMSISTTQSRLHRCCDGTVTFGLYTSPGCGGTNSYTISNGSTVISSGAANNGQIVTVGNLCPGNYTLRDGTGCVNQPFTITMNDRPCDSLISIDELSEVINFKAYPNPSLNDVTIEFENPLGKSSDVVIELYNMYGQKVIDIKDVISGNYTYKNSLSLIDLPSGNYMLTVQFDESFSRKVIIKK